MRRKTGKPHAGGAAAAEPRFIPLWVEADRGVPI
jgi:hypothetical protein